MAAGTQFNEEVEAPELSLIMDELEAGEAAVELDDKAPQEVLAWAIDRFGKELAICCSFQADGCAMIDMAHKIDPKIRVFTIDTGRMPQETYDVIDKYRTRYGINVEVFMPDTAVVQQMVTQARQQSFLQRRQPAPPMLPGAQGAAAAPCADELQRMGNGTKARPMGDALEYPQN